MNTIYIIIAIYLSYLILWLVINLLAYFISLAFKKPSILAVVNSISFFVVSLLNWGIGLALFVYAISLLFQGEILWFLFMIIIGISVLTWLLNLIQFPFYFISAYFMEKIDTFDFEEVKNSDIIHASNTFNFKSTDANTHLSIRAAKYFLIFYMLNLSSLLVEQFTGGEKYGLIGLIELPFIQIISGTLIIGIPYSIYHKLRYKRFLPKDKRCFFISVWKLSLIIFGSIIILIYMWVFITR